MSNDIQILGVDGKPLPMANLGGGAYRGARFDRELAAYTPPLRSADADLLPDQRTLTARSYDMARNDPMASGGLQVHLDNIIGSGLRLSAKPDYRVLGLDAEWAAEWTRDVEAKFRAYAEDPDCWIDASRRLTFSAMMGLAYRQFLTAGEIVSTAEWLPKRNSRYATAMKMVEPARMSNPHGDRDTASLRAGVKMDRHGAPVGYWFRSALDSDSRYTGSDTYVWKYVPRETKWGRQQVLHIFEQERADQTRGKAGLATVIARGFKLGKFQDTSLEAAIINSMYAAVIQSSMDHRGIAEALGSDDEATSYINSVLGAMTEFHGSETVKMDGVKIPHLYPGEELNFTSLNHPGPNFAEFEKSFLRNMAAGMNLSYEQLSRDYSDTNYSGARAGLLESWKFFTSRRQLIGARFASAVYALWLEEAIDKGEVQLPGSAPSFYAAKSAWCRARWIGPGKGHIDPLKESKADQLEMDMHTLTLEDACAERGRDWEENLEQIAREKRRMKELDLSPEEVKGYMAPEPPETE